VLSRPEPICCIIGAIAPDELSGRVIIGAQAPAVFGVEIKKLLPPPQSKRL
jgi:hypothetical protein